MIIDKSIGDFLDELASKSPTPGGGGAAAIMGGMGAALVSMVCHLSIGKAQYEDVSAEMKSTLDAAESLRRRLAELVQSDVQAFDQVMAAYGLPKSTDEEKQSRSLAIQDALKSATHVPLECAKACAELIDLSRTVAEKGNKNVVTDAGVAVLAAHAALKSAALNVYVNTNAIRDEHFVHERLSELNALLTGTEASSEEIYEEVRRRL